MQREILVDAAETGDEMVFERAYRTFCGVAAMKRWWDQLVIDSLVAEKRFEGCRAFVVEAVQLGPQPSGDQACVKDLEGGEDARAGATSHGFHEDGIAIIVVHHEYVVVANARGNDEFSGLVRMNLSGRGSNTAAKHW